MSTYIVHVFATGSGNSQIRVLAWRANPAPRSLRLSMSLKQGLYGTVSRSVGKPSKSTDSLQAEL